MLFAILLLIPLSNPFLFTIHSQDFVIQWEKSYGKFPWWSARYEGPQPVGDCDGDSKNELLIGGRDPFMRVMKYDEREYIL